MLVVLAVLSIGIGNVVAIAQANLKRMLAYSTIAHMGFLFLGIIPGTGEGFAAAMFYVIVYAVMALGAFGMIVVLSREGFEADRIDDFRGLNERSPWQAFLMLVLMLSMAGVPPFVGFWAKWSVLREVVAADLVWLAVVAVVFSVVGLFYYLRIVKLMYFDEPGEPALSVANPLRLVISVNALSVLVVGLFPGALLGWCLGRPHRRGAEPARSAGGEGGAERSSPTPRTGRRGPFVRRRRSQTRPDTFPAAGPRIGRGEPGRTRPSPLRRAGRDLPAA